MSKLLCSYSSISKKKSIKLFLLSIIITSIFISIQPFEINNVRAHYPLADPIEIFSIWNDTAPLIDGQINFNETHPATEWNMAAVYNMYDDLQNIRTKLLLQNDNDHLYIGLDITAHIIEDPVTEWGSSIYLDLNHNGIIDSSDRAIVYRNFGAIETVKFQYWNSISSSWEDLETSTPGTIFLSYDIIMDTYFGSSGLVTVSHRQYEYKIGLSELDLAPQNLVGVLFEATNKEVSRSGSFTWPFIDSSFLDTTFREKPYSWGDLRLGHEFTFEAFVIEDNFNILDDQIGENYGTFLATGDIDGDSELELIVSSNKTDSSANYLLAIYKYVSGEITQIWNSWTAADITVPFIVKGIATYDFDGNGEDEVFICGDDPRVIRLFDWSSSVSDFQKQVNVFSNSVDLSGYIDIGDGLNYWTGEKQIVIGDVIGRVHFIDYTINKKFAHAGFMIPDDVDGTEPVTYIHDVEIGDMDNESSWQEVIILSQFSSNGSTALHIYEFDVDSYYDNPTFWASYHEDDLFENSSKLTYDYYGHTIIIDDVDNDGENETIIVGRDYLKIFGPFTFLQTEPPLEIAINDGISDPNMGGGAGVIDLDDDGDKELIVGCNNGTIIVYEVIDSDSDPLIEDLSLSEEWRMDIGSCPGKRNSILGYDIDGDGATEAIISDSFGQIFIIGEGPNPEITITSPSSGTSNKQNILLEWEISNESLPIDSISIYLNGFLEYKTGGSQDSAIIPLEAGSNNIDIYCIDVTSKIAFDYISIVYSASAPEIDITLPTNYYVTDSSSIRVEFWADDPDVDDTLSFDVYRNSSLQAVTPTPIGSDNYYVDVDLPSDGLWLITIVVSDGTNEANDSVYVIRDTVNPVVTITSPLDGSAIKSTTIDLYWDAYDDSSWIEYCEVYRNEILLGVSYSNSYLDIALVSDDIYSLKVVAYDAIGKFSEDIVYITRDTGTPYAYLDSLSLPANYEGYYYTSISSVFVSWYGEDNVGGTGLDKFELIVDGTSFDFSPDVLNTTILLSSEGPNEIRIIAWDFAGNSAFDFYIIAYDTQNPDVNITSPEDDFVTSSDTVNVKWNGFDEGAGIEYYEIIVNGTLVEIITDISTSSYLVDLPEEKDYIITVKAVDFLGNFDEDTILVRRDADTPTFYINIPEDLYSYSTSPLIFVSWGITNIFLDTFEIFVDGIHYNSYPNTTFSDLVDVTTIIGIIPEDSFPEVNITIAVNNGGIYTWVLSRFVTIDQSSPLVSILTPENNDEIPEDSLYISWSGFDTGSGIDQYILYINNRLIQYYGSSSVDTTLDISSYEEGYYNITLSAFDYAGNCDNSSIIVEFYPNPPEFNVDLPSFVITNDPNFPINVQVTNVGYGVELIQIIADNIIIVDALNFEGDIQYDPDSYLFAITDDDFLIEIDDHNLTITVYDQASRWSNIFVDIVIDYVAPTIFDRPILGDTRISLDLNILEITDVYDENVYDISITTRDTNGVGSVSLNITNDTTTFQYNMILNKGQSIGDIFVFEVTIDFNIFAAGVYEFKFDAVDVAGNSISSSYSFNITISSDGPPTSPPIGGSKWLRENLFTIVIPSTGGILFIILLSAILSVTTRKKRLNRGWEDAIVAVAYVTKTGLTLTYVPYSPDLFEDEQLFGGALTGIMSILGEITGETEVAMKVHVMEYGDKRLMICSGYFGNGILLVTDVKSKLKELLKQFINDFETAYKFSLTQELIDLNEYSSAPLLVESIFGFRKNIFQRQTDQLLNTIDTQDYSTPEHDTSHQTNQDIAVSYYQENYEENANNEYRNEEY